MGKIMHGRCVNNPPPPPPPGPKPPGPPPPFPVGVRCEAWCNLHTIVQNEVAESRAASCPAAGSLINTAESCSGKLLHPHYCDAVQLYHLPTDPQEQHSLAGMAEHAARVHGLTKLLQRFEERRAKTHTQ